MTNKSINFSKRLPIVPAYKSDEFIKKLNQSVISTETIKTLMFAVAFSRPTYADTCTLRGLNIKYDGVVTYIQLAVGSDLTKYEAKVRITGDTIGVTSSTNCDKLLISVVTNV